MSEALVAAAQDISQVHAGHDAAVARDVGGIFAAHGKDSDFSDTVHVLLPEIITQHAEAAALYTTHWYENLSPTSKFTAKPYPEVPPEQIDKMIDWALYAPGEEPPVSRMTGSSQRIVRNVSRDTVTKNAADEGVLWARYAQPTACSYCRILAMRGSGRADRKWLYKSDKTAQFRADGEKYHTHCFCEPVPVREGGVWVPPEYMQPWDKEYVAAKGRVKPGKDYLKRIASDMRSNEPKPEKPEPEPEPEPEFPDMGEIERVAGEIQTAAQESRDKQDTLAEARRIAQEEAAQAAQAELDELRTQIANEFDLSKVQALANRLLPDTSVVLMDYNGSFPRAEAGEDIRGTIRAVDHVLTKYPEVKLDRVAFNEDEATTYGSTTFRARLQQIAMNMNRNWVSNPEDFNTSFNQTVEVGFHYPGVENEPGFNIAMHEMGHAVDFTAYNNGTRMSERDAMQALADYYVATRTGDDLTAENFDQWLRDNLSHYSLKEGSDTALEWEEAVAEAFADVEINGDEAHETSKVLHAVLIGALYGKSYMNERYGHPATV